MTGKYQELYQGLRAMVVFFAAVLGGPQAVIWFAAGLILLIGHLTAVATWLSVHAAW